jgi:hypothetical protein
LSSRRSYWAVVALILLSLAVISARIYRPGELVEFGDTIYPVRPDLTFAHWSAWWWTGNLGSLWTNTAWLPQLALPYLVWRLHVDPGIGQALQYFFWAAVPVIGIAGCIAALVRERLNWLAAMPVITFIFNLYVTLQWTQSVACYALGSAALFAWALVEGIERRRLARSMFVAALAALWLAPDASNPPYFLIVAVHTTIFAIWLFIRNRTTCLEIVRYCTLFVCVATAASARWLVPFAINYSHYPLTQLATSGANSYQWVTHRAHLVNVLRYTPVWYWGDPSYTYYSADYQNNAFLLVGSFAPWLLVLLAFAIAVQRNLKSVIALFALTFFWAFLTKASNVPFAEVSDFVSRLPLMSLFRDTEKFTIPLLVDVTVAMGITLASYEVRLPLRAVVGTIAVFAGLTGGWLMIGGEMWTAPRGTPPLYVRVPRSYLELARRLNDGGLHRVALSPEDDAYQVGTRWGFFGADTEFFDDLPALPLLHHPYVGYVDHVYYDELWDVYRQAATSDSVAWRTIDRRLSVDGAVVRTDLIPYIGIERSLWRTGDLSPAFTPLRSARELSSFASPLRAPYAYSASVALSADVPIYKRIFADLLALGMNAPPLIASPQAGSPVERVVIPNEGGAAGALVVHPGEAGRFTVPPGGYGLLVRAAADPAYRQRDLDSGSTPGLSRRESILGLDAGLDTESSNAEPIGAHLHYETEGPYPATARLALPLLGPHFVSCADIRLDGHPLETVRVNPGRRLLYVTSVVPPGKFEITAFFDPPGRCASGSFGRAPLWTSGAAPPAASGVPVHAQSNREVFARSFPMSMPLSDFPSVAISYREPIDEDEQEAFLLVHIAGAGCRTAVAVHDGENVVDRLDDIERRPMLPSQCVKAAVDRLNVHGVDLVVVAFPNALQRPQEFSIAPAAPARDWHAWKELKPAVDAAGAQRWRFGGLSETFASHPVLRIEAPNECFQWLSLKAEFGGAQTGGFHIFGIQPDETTGSVATISLTDPARMAWISPSAELQSLDLSSVAPAKLRRSCGITAAAVAGDAMPRDRAWVSLDGQRLTIPRDSRPHAYTVRLAGGSHIVRSGGPMEVAGLFPKAAFQVGRPLFADENGMSAYVSSPSWIIYSQAFDSLWRARRGDDGIQQDRADDDLQAYYVDRPGFVRIAFSLGLLRTLSELVTWATFCVVTALAIWRWRCE